MKKIITVAAVLLFAQVIFAQSVKIKLAIANCENQSENRFEPDILSAVSDYLRMYLEGEPRFEIIPKESHAALDLSLQNCMDKLCRIRMGQALKADSVLYSFITSKNGKFEINAELIDITTKNAKISLKDDWNGERASIDSVSSKIVRRIVAKQANMDALNSNMVTVENTKSDSDESEAPTPEPAPAISFASGNAEADFSYKQQMKDLKTCEKMRLKPSEKAWKKYLKRFPNGRCAAEAKEELDRMACEEAEKDASLKGWKEYLENYPEGKCAQKAKDAPDNFACEKARKNHSEKGWMKYLEEFKQGLCAKEAGEQLDLIACKEAKDESSLKYWKKYLDRFPSGRCAAEAADFIKKKDSEACKDLKEKLSESINNSWKKRRLKNNCEDYLKYFPEGQCAAKAKEFIKNN